MGQFQFLVTILAFFFWSVNCHSLPFVVICCHSLSRALPLAVNRCHWLSLAVTCGTTCCHLLSLDVPLVSVFIFIFVSMLFVLI